MKNLFYVIFAIFAFFGSSLFPVDDRLAGPEPEAFSG